MEEIGPGHTVACLRWRELVTNDYGKNDPACFFCDVRAEAGLNLNRVRNENSVLYRRQNAGEPKTE